MDIEAALRVLEKAPSSDFDEDKRRRLGQLVRIEDSVGDLPTPCGPLVACPMCRHPLTIAPALKEDPKSGEEECKRKNETGHEDRKPCAYTTLLYGDSVPYLLGTLVLGQSLKKHSDYDRILMHTFDVPKFFLEILSTYWTLKKVDYIYGSKWLYTDYERSRFHKVFTKLQVFSLTEYSKVLMLDNDMLIRQSLDHLFDMEAPAAMRRHGGCNQPAHGERFSAHQCWINGTQCLGINAGTMLLEPDEQIHARMIDEVINNHVEHQQSCGPEQDYISRFYTTFGLSGIGHIGCEYNYQILLDENYTSPHYKSLGKDDIKVAHFSGKAAKPWQLDTSVILHQNGVIREKYHLEGCNSGVIWSDLTWEWVFACREAEKDVKLRVATSFLLPAHSLEDLIEKELAEIRKETDRMKASEELDPNDAEVVDAELGDWGPRKWVTWSNRTNGWIQFRPHHVYWSDAGLGKWDICGNKMYLVGAHNLCLKRETNDAGNTEIQGRGFYAWPGYVMDEDASSGDGLKNDTCIRRWDHCNMLRRWKRSEMGA